MKKILSLDPSTHSTGYAIFENRNLIAHGYLKDSSNNTYLRIEKMVEAIKEIIIQENIDEIVIEEVYIEQGINNQTYKVLMHLQGGIMLMINSLNKIKDTNFKYPSEWRKQCGIKTGNKKKREELKQEDINFVKEIYKIEVNDDEADAICIGHAYSNNDLRINFE